MVKEEKGRMREGLRRWDRYPVEPLWLWMKGHSWIAAVDLTWSWGNPLSALSACRRTEAKQQQNTSELIWVCMLMLNQVWFLLETHSDSFKEMSGCDIFAWYYVGNHEEWDLILSTMICLCPKCYVMILLLVLFCFLFFLMDAPKFRSPTIIGQKWQIKVSTLV